MASFSEIGGFDANVVEPNAPFEVLPAGEYEVVITASEMKPTKTGTGKYLELELQVLSGEYQNRKVWDRLNLINPNAQAQQIARGTLSAICRAVNVPTPNDSGELHNKPLVAVVKVEKRADNGALSNSVAGYKPRATYTPPPAPQASAGASPW